MFITNLPLMNSFNKLEDVIFHMQSMLPEGFSFFRLKYMFPLKVNSVRSGINPSVQRRLIVYCANTIIWFLPRIDEQKSTRYLEVNLMMCNRWTALQFDITVILSRNATLFMPHLAQIRKSTQSMPRDKIWPRYIRSGVPLNPSQT